MFSSIHQKSKTLNDLYKKPEKEKTFATYNISKPNIMHQIDILHFTNDNGYKYILNLVDVYSRKVAGQALKTVKMNEITKALDLIYDKSKFLKYPNCISADNEFNSYEFKKDARVRFH